MNHTFFNRICSFVVLIAIVISCSSNLDFNQKIGENITPNFKVENIIEKDIYENSNEITISVIPIEQLPIEFVSEPIPFKIDIITTDDKILNNLKKVILHMTFSNAINQKFTIYYDFKDVLSNSIQKGTVIVKAGDSIGETKNIDFNDIEKLKSVEKIEFKGSIKELEGSKISPGKLSIKSDVEIFLKL
jgi:hypothetical protein